MYWPIAGILLAHSLRRLPNIKPALSQRLMFTKLSANTTGWNNDVLMLSKGLRRWPNIKILLFQNTKHLYDICTTLYKCYTNVLCFLELPFGSSGKVKSAYQPHSPIGEKQSTWWYYKIVTDKQCFLKTRTRILSLLPEVILCVWNVSDYISSISCLVKSDWKNITFSSYGFVCFDTLKHLSL